MNKKGEARGVCSAALPRDPNRKRWFCEDVVDVFCPSRAAAHALRLAVMGWVVIDAKEIERLAIRDLDALSSILDDQLFLADGPAGARSM